MAKKLNPDKLRRDRANQIEQLRRVLERHHQICHDLSPLYDAISACKLQPPQGHNYWGYTVRPLRFSKIEHLRHVKPIDADNIELSLTIQVIGKCLQEDELADPFERLIMNIIIEAEDSTEKKLISCWHLDKHIEGEEDNEPEFAHPCYHFHFGGKEIWNRISEQHYNFGNALILESPRLPHPPMEIILGIDFVLSNFYGTTWRMLKEDAEYRKCIKDAQNQFWKPYAIVTASAWATPVNPTWKAQEIWPQIMI